MPTTRAKWRKGNARRVQPATGKPELAPASYTRHGQQSEPKVYPRDRVRQAGDSPLLPEDGLNGRTNEVCFVGLSRAPFTTSFSVLSVHLSGSHCEGAKPVESDSTWLPPASHGADLTNSVPCSPRASCPMLDMTCTGQRFGAWCCCFCFLLGSRRAGSPPVSRYEGRTAMA